MNLVHLSTIATTGALFLRVLVRYGTHLFPWEERSIERIFAHLLETLDALIFIHKDCYISRMKPLLPEQFLKRYLNNTSFQDPLIFEGQFNLDCDSSDAGLRAEVNSPHKLPCGVHQLNVDAFFPVTSDILKGDLFELLQDEIRAFLKAYHETLESILVKEKAVPRSLTAYYFRHEDRLIRVFYPAVCKEEVKLREEIHKGLGLPQKPIIRRGLALFPTRSFRRLLGPNEKNLVSPHLLLPASNSIPNVRCEVIRGRYTYKHYLQDGVDDKNWGCAYRSLQTLASWLLWQGIVTPLQPLPSHRDIQEALVRVGDKPSKFIGSRQWIGSLEVSFCLQELYGVQCRLLPVPRGRDFAAVAASVLVEHFASGGGPVMVGGGDLAHTIVGVQVATDFPVSLAAGTNRTRFLILDPHYTGEPAHVATILGKGWVGWKEESFWRSEVPYNLCLLPPPVDADSV
uniref:Ufm1 specific protease 2 n=1 Tax=Echinococcus granulosus TaxID=6210 RepID=A0A068WED4_ECHGR|nr:Ufm1 specific protease 2 [Echinococcus granulosus]